MVVVELSPSPKYHLKETPFWGEERFEKLFIPPLVESKQTPELSKSASGLQNIVLTCIEESTQPLLSVIIRLIS